MHQVAVRHVKFDDPETSLEGAASGGDEGVDDRVDPLAVQLDRRRFAFSERDRTGSDDVPGPLLGLEPGSSNPGWGAAPFAAGVGELDAWHGSLALDEAGDPGEGFDVLVAPDSHVARRDPALRSHRGRLDEDQARASNRPAAQVDEMPVVGQPILGAVLAHRRDDDPVAKLGAFDPQGAEKVDLGDRPAGVDHGRTADPDVRGWGILDQVRTRLTHPSTTPRGNNCRAVEVVFADPSWDFPYYRGGGANGNP